MRRRSDRTPRSTSCQRTQPSGRGVPRIGDVARRRRTVTSQDIIRFTELSGDRNPIHDDDELVRASKFGEIVVKGGVTTAIPSR